MICLAIETSGPNCGVCICRGADDDAGGSAILAEQTERIGRGHAERLLPMVEDILRAAQHSFGDIDRIAVATGPGSFTGVRVGVAAARGLALALGITAVGVGSMQALAAEALHATAAATVVAALTGPRGEFFAFAAEADGATRFEPTLIPFAGLQQFLAGSRRPVAVIGSAAAAIGVFGGSSPDIQIVRETEAPAVEWIARLGLADAGTSPPVPLYLRPADAKPQAGKTIARVG